MIHEGVVGYPVSKEGLLRIQTSPTSKQHPTIDKFLVCTLRLRGLEIH